MFEQPLSHEQVTNFNQDLAEKSLSFLKERNNDVRVPAAAQELTPLQTTILTILSENNYSGYDISLMLKDNPSWKASHQQIYRELKRFKLLGLVHDRLMPNDGKPDTKINHITPLGELALANTDNYSPNLPKVVSMATVMAMNTNSRNSYFKRFAHLNEQKISKLSTESMGYKFAKTPDEVNLEALQIKRLLLKREIAIREADLLFAQEVLKTGVQCI